MSGLNELLQALQAAEQNGDQAVLATVVKVEGSAYRRPGARMLIPALGHTVGTISGGCLEADLTKKAWWLTESGEPQVQRYSTGTNEDDDEGEDAALTFGLGCNGTVYVLLERHGLNTPSAVVELLRQVRDSQLPAAVATVIGHYRQASVRVGDRVLLEPYLRYRGKLREAALDASIRRDLSSTLSEQKSSLRIYSDQHGEVEVFFEFVAAQRRLVVFGAGHDAQPLVRMAKLLDWHVTVVDGRAHFARPERFSEADAVILAPVNQPFALNDLISGSAVAVMTHSYSQDRHWLGGVLQGLPGYIGQLGPRERTERLLNELCQQTTYLPSLRQLHYPMGLDIGGDTPEAVALAILAEMSAALNQRNGGMLKYRATPIHQASAVAYQQVSSLVLAE